MPASLQERLVVQLDLPEQEAITSFLQFKEESAKFALRGKCPECGASVRTAYWSHSPLDFFLERLHCMCDAGHHWNHTIKVTLSLGDSASVPS